MKQQQTTSNKPVKEDSPLTKEIDRLAKEAGYPHIKLDHPTYMRVLKTAHENVYGSKAVKEDEGQQEGKHTPGEIDFNEEENTVSKYRLHSTVDGRNIGWFDPDEETKENDPENIKRIVECWNEHDGLKEEVESWKESKESWEHIANEREAENKKLKEDNRELLEVLKGFLHSVEHEGVISGRIVDAVRNAKSAIAKHQ